MNNLNAALKDLGFSKVKIPYSSDKKPLDEMARLAEIEKRLNIIPDEPEPTDEQEADHEEPDQDQAEDQGDDDE